MARQTPAFITGTHYMMFREIRNGRIAFSRPFPFALRPVSGYIVKMLTGQVRAR
jgi:hypothetical protein